MDNTQSTYAYVKSIACEFLNVFFFWTALSPSTGGQLSQIFNPSFDQLFASIPLSVISLFQAVPLYLFVGPTVGFFVGQLNYHPF